MKHTEATIERIREMTAAGDSYSKIAAAMGFTRNQVIGIRHRAGIQSIATTPVGRKRRAAMPRVQPVIEVVDDHEPPTRRFSINQLTSVTCRWPHGDPKSASFNYCGHDTKPDSAYCPHHHRRACGADAEQIARAANRIMRNLGVGLSRSVVSG